jgi:uncharacterized protein (TIGR03000 family)
MRRVLTLFILCFVLPAPVFADEIIFPDGSSSNNPGGLMIIRKGNQTTWSVGGAFLSRHVKVVTNTPEGKVIARFKMPSVFHDPNPAPLPSASPALVQVEIPDVHGQLFIDGELVRTQGGSRQLESPRLPLGKAYPLRIRGVYVVGDQFFIEDRQVMIRAGETTAITFDGKDAIRVPLQKD